MQFLNNLIARITTNMPLRMKVGRFGIWFAKVGRTLQVRYANWNGEFRLKVECLPHWDTCTVHVSEEVTPYAIVTIAQSDDQPDRQTPLASALFAIKGVKRVVLQRYEIAITKGKVFSWPELMPAIETAILKHLTA